MPTPRQITEVSKQVRVQASGEGAGAWIPATITDAGSEVGNTYTVALNGGASAPARSIIDAALFVGDFVWVVNTGTEIIIVGVQ
jgi:hypothetical protein